ncbi:MAG: hypothetical protein E7Z92_08065 [Cyanobacteria bacterium SIG31]|nr:hypothetical protein [Cyanobacteria bacterium SIG31]
MEEENKEPQKRQFLGVWFECCHVYGRLYKNKAGTMYYGRCPKCLRSVRARVGEGGTSRRFFRGA